MTTTNHTMAYLEDSLGHFLDHLSSREPAPGGGAAAAVAVALAAGLAGMAARFASDHLDDAPDLIARAESLRSRAAPLAQADAEAYQRVLAAYGLPRQPDPKGRSRQIHAALARAAAVPLAVAQVGADVADLAGHLAEHGNPNLRGDAITAALLAEAGARAAAVLVDINLNSPGDERVVRAARLADAAGAAARRALEARR